MNNYVLYHSGNFKQKFSKKIDANLYFSINEFCGKIYDDNIFVLYHNKGRLFHNLLGYNVEGCIYDNRIEYRFVRNKIKLIVLWLVCIFSILVFLCAIISTYNVDNNTFDIRVMFFFFLPFFMYGIPSILYDKDDCISMSNILKELCE